MKKLAITLALLIFVGPSPALLAVGLLMTPAAQAAACLPGSLTVGAIPDELTATAADGTSITLTRTQLTHAATIITVGGRTSGVGAPGVVIALMAAMEFAHPLLHLAQQCGGAARLGEDGRVLDKGGVRIAWVSLQVLHEHAAFTQSLAVLLVGSQCAPVVWNAQVHCGQSLGEVRGRWTDDSMCKSHVPSRS